MSSCKEMVAQEMGTGKMGRSYNFAFIFFYTKNYGQVRFIPVFLTLQVRFFKLYPKVMCSTRVQNNMQVVIMHNYPPAFLLPLSGFGPSRQVCASLAH
jgi:hypothetical protein